MLLFSLTILLVVVPLYPTFIKYCKTIASSFLFICLPVSLLRSKCDGESESSLSVYGYLVHCMKELC